MKQKAKVIVDKEKRDRVWNALALQVGISVNAEQKKRKNKQKPQR